MFFNKFKNSERNMYFNTSSKTMKKLEKIIPVPKTLPFIQKAF